jgi:uncharacterized membrane protein YhhN
VTSAALVLATLAGLAAIADWAAVVRSHKRLEYVFKPATVVLLIGVALALDPHDTAVRAWFVVALGFSLLGDVFLMLPRASSDRSSRGPAGNDGSSSGLFLGGLAAFLAAHVAYAGGLVTDGVTAGKVLAGVVVVAVAMAAAGWPIVRGARRAAPAMVGPVLAYMVVISTMLAVAVGTGRAVAVAGAGLFYGSDALIGWSRFAGLHPAGQKAAGEVAEAAAGEVAEAAARRGNPHARVQDRKPLLIIVTYHLGQTGLVLSLAV